METERFLSEEGYKSQERILLPVGSVCFVCIGATIGKICITDKPSFTNQQINSIIVDRHNFDNRFVYYILKTQKEKIRSIAGGAATPIVNKTAFSNIVIQVPPLPNQCKIAGILSSYDDLIENNTRRIKILEEMARTIYREWFVNFRFPGHEKVNIVDSAVGEIPEGWKHLPVEAFLTKTIGGGWGKDEQTETHSCPVRVIRGTDFRKISSGNYDEVPRRFVKPSELNSRHLFDGDLVVENSVNASSRCIGTPFLISSGLLNRLKDDAICASFCKLYRPERPAYSVLLYLHMSYLLSEGKMGFYQNVAANGIGNFQSKRFLSNEHVCVPRDIEERFDLIDKLSPFLTTVYSERVANLRYTRDLLLLKLISGELDVSELDIDTGHFEET